MLKTLFQLLISGSVCLIAATAPADDIVTEQIPEGVKVESVSVWPEQLHISSRWDVIQVLVTGHLESGQRIDLTRMARYESDVPSVSITASGQVTATEDGSGTLMIEAIGQTLEVPIAVEGVTQNASVSYVRDVAPSLSKMGCNSGTCHGAKDGQRGFKLSLRGYDYEYDHRALTDDIGARRFNRANPDQSLMLLKASGSIAHVGGALTQPGERHYETLRQWIAQGAALDLDAARVTKIELVPNNPILPRAKLRQQMVVMATYSDGTVRDVTSDAFIESGNIELLEANRQGVVTTLRRGEAPILARFEGAYTATTITIMGDRSGFAWEQPPTHNYIDEFVYDKLQRVKILPSSLCTDEDFVRRVYLDLTGLPPTADQVREFLGDASPSRAKRDALVDRLVGSPAFVEHWTNKWADLLQVNRKYLGEVGAASLRAWIQEAVATNRPYDQFAHELLTASGSTLDNPAAAYWKILREPSAAMENTTHLFLAVRFNCNKCHDHPFERWTQDQYYQMTAFFAQVGRKEDPDFAGQRIGGSAVDNPQPLVEVIYDTNSGDTVHDRTGQVTPPEFPYTSAGETDQDVSRREKLAHWVISPDNRYFASSYVNRLWGYLTGVGLIEPIDDIRAGNPPTNPALLARLTQDFVESGFDVQHMIRTICKSRVYQHSVETNEWNADDAINYSHALPRRLPAEVLYDAIHVATGATSKLPGVPAGLRAAQLPDAGVSLPFLEDFGRPPRESACECERTSGIVLGPIMKLINGPTVNNAIASSDNAITKLVESEADDSKLIEELFLRFLARRPTERELTLGVEALKASQNDREVAAAELEKYRAERLAQLDEWEASLPRPAVWHELVPVDASSTAGAELTVGEDGIIGVSGTREKDTYLVVSDLAIKELAGFRLEALPDESLPSGGPGRADNGNFVVNEIVVRLGNPQDLEGAQTVALTNAHADFSQSGWDVAGAIDGNAGTGWAIMPEFNKPHVATFEATKAYPVGDSAQLIVQIQHDYSDGKHNLGKFRLAVTDSRPPFSGPELPGEVAAVLATPKAERTDEQQRTLESYFLDQDPKYAGLVRGLELAETQAAQFRLTGAQDLAWALINTPAFLFNR